MPVPWYPPRPCWQSKHSQSFRATRDTQRSKLAPKRSHQRTLHSLKWQSHCLVKRRQQTKHASSQEKLLIPYSSERPLDLWIQECCAFEPRRLSVKRHSIPLPYPANLGIRAATKHGDHRRKPRAGSQGRNWIKSWKGDQAGTTSAGDKPRRSPRSARTTSITHAFLQTDSLPAGCRHCFFDTHSTAMCGPRDLRLQVIVSPRKARTEQRNAASD